MHHKQTILDSYSLSLLLFFYALLIPTHLSLGGWLFVTLWSLLTIFVLPRAFYHLDRIHLKRDVSIAMVVLSGLTIMVVYIVMGRAFYLDLDVDLLSVALFLLLSVLIARIENVYESRTLSATYGRAIMVGVVIITLFILTRYTLRVGMSTLYDFGVIDVGSLRFWHSPAGRLFIIGFWILIIDQVGALISIWRGDRE